jgi:DNA-binding NarL/FixJ family response regulator
MTAHAAIRIGILEDDLAFRAYLCEALTQDPEIAVVFAETTIAEAKAQLPTARPDVLLVDMQLPDGSGLELVKAAAAELPACKIIMLTVLFGRSNVVGAIESGAHGYLLKDTPPLQIRTAIRDVLADHAPISPAAATHLLANLQRVSPDPLNAPTPREREMLELLAKGLSYAEAAAVLGISVHTVGDHIKAIYRKLSVNSKNEAIFEGRQKGWLSLAG